MAESRLPAVLINGRHGKERGLAAAPVCAELARAAARLRLGMQAGLAWHRCLPAARPAAGWVQEAVLTARLGQGWRHACPRLGSWDGAQGVNTAWAITGQQQLPRSTHTPWQWG